MNNELPSDRLQKPTKRLPWILSGLGAAALVTAGVIAGPAIAANLNPVPTPTPTTTEYVATLTPAEVDSIGQIATDQQTQIDADKAAAAAAQAAADAAAAKAAQHQSAAAGAPGSRVPFIKSDDPNNANGGDYEDPGIFCQSHSASGNPPVCD